jgi:SPP1 gp7 family putative phage head morphogenesis protein
MPAMVYQPAPGYWRTTPRHIVLWATIGVLDRIERQVPERRVLRRYEARLRRIIERVVTRDAALRWWRMANKAADDPIPDAELDRAVSVIVQALTAEVQSLRKDALASVEQRFGRGLPPALKERAINAAFELVRNIPDTLRDELRRTMRETLKERRTQFDFARTISRQWQEISRKRAELIARTEWARVAGQATLDLYRQQGTRGKIWYTVADAKVCPICQSNAAAGPIPIDEAFPGGVDTTPQHPRCRCAVAGAIPPGAAAPPPAEEEEGPLPGLETDGTRKDFVEDSKKASKIFGPTTTGRERSLKQHVMRLLAKYLSDTAEARALAKDVQQFSVARFSDDWREDLAAKLIGQWAVTSSDKQILSIALQLAAKKEFGLDEAHTDHFSRRHYQEAKDFLAKHEPILRGFLRGMYKETQAWLREHGIKHIWLARGVAHESPPARPWSSQPRARLQDTRLQPLSSYSSSEEIALVFADDLDEMKRYRGVYFAKVPARRILSSPFTGFGCHAEYEFVVLGGADRQRVVSWTGERYVEDPSKIAFGATVKEAAVGQVLEPDRELSNADWTKMTQDLSDEEAEAMRQLLREQGWTEDEIDELPFFKLPRLRREAERRRRRR